MKLTKLQRQLSWVKTIIDNLGYGVAKVKKEFAELEELVEKKKRTRRKVTRAETPQPYTWTGNKKRVRR